MSTTIYISKQTNSQFNLWTNKPPLLTDLDMELTERCNNDCVHCCICQPKDDQSVKNRELQTDEIKDVLSEAASLGILCVRFTGGEPLIRQDFPEIYLFARKLGLKVLLFTNARLITLEIAELFSKIPPLDKIEVTVYGMSELSYEAVTRKKGSYEEFRRGIDLLLNHNIPFVVKGAMLPTNRHGIEVLAEWAKTIPWMDESPSHIISYTLRDRRDSECRNNAIKRLRIPPEEVISILKLQEDKYYKEMRQFCQKFMGPCGDVLFECGAGHNPCVDAYGYLLPCLPLKHPDTSFDLKNGSLREALTEFFPKIRELSATNKDYLNRCARCFLKGLCEQCPAKSWSEHGTLDTPVEYFCEMAHLQAKDLGLLKGNEKGWEVKNWMERASMLN